jgi:hypothetical protein
MRLSLVILFASVLTTTAQSLVEPERAAEVRRTFDRATRAAPLRCNISPVRPALTFGFRFQTGYRLGLPLVQFPGPGHELTVYVRVVPGNRPPVYLTATNSLPDAADLKADAVANGMFVVGEGVYRIDLLVLDDQRRACRSTWQIQARRSGNERQLVPTTPPGTVAELASGDPAAPAGKNPRDIAKLTIFLHAAPLSPNRPKLLPDDVALLTESISALLRQWPARLVRLIAFNLDQRSVVLRKDKFGADQIDELTSQLERLDFGSGQLPHPAGRGKAN